jgi:hypothetical protein
MRINESYSMLSAPDAENLRVPIAIYASKDEPLEEVSNDHPSEFRVT